MTDFEQAKTTEELLAVSPEQTLRGFLQFFREVKPRYEEAVRLQAMYEDQLSDLLHYAELHTNLSASNGNKLYRKIAEARRQRRAFKEESEMLEPMYQYVQKASYLVDQLSGVQGKTTAAREKIERRVYHCRTDILDDLPE